ncbi:hypothetical protein NBG4_490008 [Candidatus Sulfobium mesophilum]|uniref:Uncharacterized protein n=1 Tax=Candidatus Sulfobium mesophilum TaxID=2016548 RepID=A0A2U3QIQ5_9BACT|nr:hypothetical protein NBG4_490008 [Candidatus Sulfobium mesophilum]
MSATTWHWNGTNIENILETMNAKMNALIDKEVGEDVGQMLPASVDRGWVATPAVNDL